MKKISSYNIHDIITIASEGVLPELEPFRVELPIEKPTIRVQVGQPHRKTKENNHASYLRYREAFGSLGFDISLEIGETINVVACPSLLLSPHVLYTNVIEPLLRWTFVRKGYALVHGATIAFGDAAYMITARTDTGKTTTLLKILACQRRDNDCAAFISDDMTLISPAGIALTYPKPLTISYHTLRAVNADTLTFGEKLSLPIQSRIHSRSGRQVAFWIRNSALPAATINMVAQMLVPPPKYFVNKLVPQAKLAKAGTLTGIFIIERGEESIHSVAPDEALETLLKNCEDAYGFPPYEVLKDFLYHQDGIDLREKEQTIISQALGQLPATVFRSSNLDWWRQIPAYVNEKVANDIAHVAKLPALRRPDERLLSVS